MKFERLTEDRFDFLRLGLFEERIVEDDVLLQSRQSEEERVRVRRADRTVDDPDFAEREVELLGEVFDARVDGRVGRQRRELVEEGHDHVGVDKDHGDLNAETARRERELGATKAGSMMRRGAYMKTMSQVTMRRMASEPAQWMILMSPATSGTSNASETNNPASNGRGQFRRLGQPEQASPAARALTLDLVLGESR